MELKVLVKKGMLRPNSEAYAEITDVYIPQTHPLCPPIVPSTVAIIIMQFWLWLRFSRVRIAYISVK